MQRLNSIMSNRLFTSIILKVTGCLQEFHVTFVLKSCSPKLPLLQNFLFITCYIHFCINSLQIGFISLSFFLFLMFLNKILFNFCNIRSTGTIQCSSSIFFIFYALNPGQNIMANREIIL